MRGEAQYWNGKIPWASVKDFKSSNLDKTIEFITEEGLFNSASNLIPENTIIIPTRMALGKVAINSIPLAINQDLKALFVEDESILNKRYLARFLKSQANHIEENGSGATVKGITLDFLRKLPIPLPPLEEQRRIVEILDAAQALIDQRKQQIVLMDQLVQSLFYDMFGDPVSNPMGWDECELQIHADIKSGVTKGRKFGEKKTVYAPYMRVANVQDGHLVLDDITEVEVLPSDIEKYKLIKNDILLTEGGDPDKLGRGAIWQGEIDSCIHQNHIFRVRLNGKCLLPEYASKLIGSSRGKRYFFKMAKQTTGIASINMGQLKKCPMLLPPLSLQQEFAERVAAIEAQKAAMSAALKEQEDLFAALMQAAFKGEL
ncbi:restriction endonuclease subunit S [Pontiellaceae bacterium B1224]|nr:restriction endonuclease subunit S [Pontiellaceae bacterium B1224]